MSFEYSKSLYSEVKTHLVLVYGQAATERLWTEFLHMQDKVDSMLETLFCTYEREGMQMPEFERRDNNNRRVMDELVGAWVSQRMANILLDLEVDEMAQAENRRVA